ncbi:tRNA dihydrouridine(20/20a) synthase DusA [Melittangium boletus]|uniref:tRNA-dihydrouridine(20/20a) synthase n=1 Tax=Melittangium boletus DSM 14713 TaxID=1294270 RepID=A0A250ISX5_9BACT|nr:tRNA dihydrouridine(20/20a) synthase DusA [Melittangium boletus]ATB34363.1 tRNA-dihydrouridine synthase [Melittangium boletus DSM 14713]
MTARPSTPAMSSHRLSVAPMMDWTDRHDRFFLRLLSKRTRLYTEMVTVGAIIHGDKARHLDFSHEEHPVALQLGGSDPAQLAECVRIAEQWGYDEVNLNVGCPSDRVQNGMFGACLMAKPDLVARCVEAMRGATRLPVTVKHRLGIDDLDSYELLTRFVRTVSGAGCDTFIVHARKAILQGLSPKENREIPPLRYDWVRQLKADFPHLTLSLNGGVKSLEEARAHLAWADGVMIGREAYQNPYLLARVDSELFGETAPAPTRRQVVQGLEPYIEELLARGEYLSRVTRHILGLFAGQPGARGWRRVLSERANKPGAGMEVLRDALAQVPDRVLDEPATGPRSGSVAGPLDVGLADGIQAQPAVMAQEALEGAAQRRA